MIEELLQLSVDDVAVITTDRGEYRGVVTYTHHDAAEYECGVPVRGELQIDMDLSSESAGEYDLQLGQVEIRIDERQPGSWDNAEASVYDPEVVEDEVGLTVHSDYRSLGAVNAVEVVSDD